MSASVWWPGGSNHCCLTAACMTASCTTWLAPQMMTVLCMATCVRPAMAASSQADLQWPPTPTAAAAPAAGDEQTPKAAAAPAAGAEQTMPPIPAVENSHSTACFCSTHSTSTKQKIAQLSIRNAHQSRSLLSRSRNAGFTRSQENTPGRPSDACRPPLCCYDARHGLAMQAHCTIQWRLGDALRQLCCSCICCTLKL